MKGKQDLRTVRTFRLNDAELAVIRKGAAAVGVNWTIFVRRAALIVASCKLAPATVEVDGELIALVDGSPKL